MFVVIDGLDGSGKSTQLNLMEEFFAENNYRFKRIKLPDYESPSSALVKMYLNGSFGTEPQDVNIYAASAFYTVDRYANFVTKWKSDYLDGVHIIADRYTTSNAIYQTAKIPRKDWDDFLKWLEDFEYVKTGIPKPDLTIFLDMPVQVSQKLMTKRYSGDELKKDVHEKNVDFLNHCRKAALYTAEKWDWVIVNCAENNMPRSVESINHEIISIIKEALND